MLDKIFKTEIKFYENSDMFIISKDEIPKLFFSSVIFIFYFYIIILIY